LIGAYRDNNSTASPSELLIAIAGDYNYRLPTLAVADRQSAQNAAPVYAYEFDWKSPARNGVLGSPHTSEVPFIFGTLEAARPLIQDSPDQLQVRDRIGAIWAQFAAPAIRSPRRSRLDALHGDQSHHCPARPELACGG